MNRDLSRADGRADAGWRDSADAGPALSIPVPGVRPSRLQVGVHFEEVPATAPLVEAPATGLPVTEKPTPAKARTRVSEPATAQERVSWFRERRGTIAIVVALLAVNLIGLPYFFASVADRVRSPLHPWFKPTGYIGQTAGIVATLLFFYLWLYPLRKRHRRLAFTGTMKRWLDLHVVGGLVVPVVAAVHATWRFDGLIGLGYAAMIIVCVSGIVGRYLYSRIPRSRSGIALSLEQIETRRGELMESIARSAGLDLEAVAELLTTQRNREAPGPSGVLFGLIADDWYRWRRTLRLAWGWRHEGPDGKRLDRKTRREVLRLARREMALAQQVQALDATQRVFRFWHVAHRPFAVTALVAVVIHVIAAISLGVTWFW